MGANEITYYSGETIPFEFIFNDGDAVAIDVSGDELCFMVKKAPNDADADAIITLAETAMTIVTNNVSFTLSETQTDLAEQRYYYELKWKVSATEIYVVVQDYFTINKAVCRRVT